MPVSPGSAGLAMPTHFNARLADFWGISTVYASTIVRDASTSALVRRAIRRPLHRVVSLMLFANSSGGWGTEDDRFILCLHVPEEVKKRGREGQDRVTSLIGYKITYRVEHFVSRFLNSYISYKQSATSISTYMPCNGPSRCRPSPCGHWKRQNNCG